MASLQMSIRMTEELFGRIEVWGNANGFPAPSAAARALIARGLEASCEDSSLRLSARELSAQASRIEAAGRDLDGMLGEIAVLGQNAENASTAAHAVLAMLTVIMYEMSDESDARDGLGYDGVCSLFRKVGRALSGNPGDFWKAWRWTIGYGELSGYTPSMLLCVSDEEYGRLVLGKDPGGKDGDG